MGFGFDQFERVRSIAAPAIRNRRSHRNVPRRWRRDLDHFADRNAFPATTSETSATVTIAPRGTGRSLEIESNEQAEKRKWPIPRSTSAGPPTEVQTDGKWCCTAMEGLRKRCRDPPFRPGVSISVVEWFDRFDWIFFPFPPRIASDRTARTPFRSWRGCCPFSLPDALPCPSVVSASVRAPPLAGPARRHFSRRFTI